MVPNHQPTSTAGAGHASTKFHLVVGRDLPKSICPLSKIAEKIPGNARLPSLTHRLSRFLDNPAIRVREWYRPITISLLQRVADGEVRLIVDGSKVGFGHQLLVVALAYRKPAIPLAWTWMNSNRGHSTSLKQKALLAYVYGLIPSKTSVILVGDADFSEIEVQKLLKMWPWQYVLRQKGRYLIKPKGQRDVQRLDSLVEKPGQSVWLPSCRLTAKYAYPVSLLACWKISEKEPWFLATNLVCPQTILRVYRRRMWIEEMSGDLKGHGFDLEKTHLRHFLHLSRLTLAVVV